MIIMKCGHAAYGELDGKPVCAICVGIDPRAQEIDDSPPDLTGRTAVCPYCKSERPSDFTLPFFEYRPGERRDDFYCGCRGWE